MKLDPINTIIGDVAGVGKVNVAVRSNGGLIREVLESGEVNVGDVGPVLSVDAKRPIEQWTRGVGLAFNISCVIWLVIWLDGSNKYGNASKYVLIVNGNSPVSLGLPMVWYCRGLF